MQLLYQSTFTSFLILIILYTCQCDIYLHTPRGSNNRLSETSRNRNNDKRLFDSQNNDRGGYNQGNVYYHEGSTVSIEWTNQHSCGNQNSNCELILQYMCDDNVRDGTVTTTIPSTSTECENGDCSTDYTYGMHEDFYYYSKCKLRERNKGLFTADQNLRKNTAIYTRQNPQGTRRGYECPEERDYYPYWHPTPWKDIAVLTNDATRCSYYQEQSENVKSRWECVVADEYFWSEIDSTSPVIPNNEAECEALECDGIEGTCGVWTEVKSHDIDAPECHETFWSRDNHLGNGLGGFPLMYNWTVPDLDHENCILRIRYNISTGEFDGWDSEVNADLNDDEGAVGVGSLVGFTDTNEAEDRGFVFEQNPQIQIFDQLDDMVLQLAVNTNQYGRTFQDRSHVFAVRSLPDGLEGATVHNVQVRGKRGNIVQVYPAVEYDYTPNRLTLKSNDYIHFQWTGSNNNPTNNDGQGTAGTDRSNIVLQSSQVYTEGSGTAGDVYGYWGRSYPMHLDNATFLGLSEDDLVDLAILSKHQFGGDMTELDDAGTYFDLGLKKVTTTGTYYYMCTRNNNFSNRSQKGKLSVVEYAVTLKYVGWNGGTLTTESGSATLAIEQGALSGLTSFTLEEWPTDFGESVLSAENVEMSKGVGYASDYIVLNPESKFTDNHTLVTMTMDVSSVGFGQSVELYRSTTDNLLVWSTVSADISGNMAQFQLSQGGLYVARTEYDIGTIVGTTVAILLVLAIIGFALALVHYFRAHPEKWLGVKNHVSRSFQAKV